MASPLNRQPPTIAEIIVATAIIAALGGFLLGQASSLELFGIKRSAAGNGKVKSSNDESQSDFEEGEEDDDDGQKLEAFEEDNDGCKMVFVVRTDLGMTKGKIAAQCGHATLACYKTLHSSHSSASILRRWERGGQMKIALQVKSEEELDLLQAQAMSLGICARIIHDAGHTQVAPNSATVLGIGPAPRRKIDQITKHLKLL